MAILSVKMATTIRMAKMKFLNTLLLARVGEATWAVLKPFHVDHRLVNVKVEEAFRTDLASVPAWLRWLLPPDGEYKTAAVIHDWLLKLMYEGDRSITRAIAARVFLDTMRYEKVALWKIAMLYLGVRGMDLYKWWTE